MKVLVMLVKHFLIKKNLRHKFENAISTLRCSFFSLFIEPQKKQGAG